MHQQPAAAKLEMQRTLYKMTQDCFSESGEKEDMPDDMEADAEVVQKLKDALEAWLLQ